MDLFERLSEGRPPQGAAAPPTPQSISATARELLDWMQHCWKKPVIRARDIYRHGPAPVRWNKENAINAAETLARHGWLLPIRADRRDAKRWQVTTGPV
jgi:hypothetical protein